MPASVPAFRYFWLQLRLGCFAGLRNAPFNNVNAIKQVQSKAIVMLPRVTKLSLLKALSYVAWRKTTAYYGIGAAHFIGA